MTSLQKLISKIHIFTIAFNPQFHWNLPLFYVWEELFYFLFIIWDIYRDNAPFLYDFFLRCKILYCIVRWGKTDKWMTQCSVLPSAKNSLVGLKQPPFALCPSLPNRLIDLATMLFDNARMQHPAVAYKTTLFAMLAKVNVRFAAVFENVTICDCHVFLNVTFQIQSLKKMPCESS